MLSIVILIRNQYSRLHKKVQVTLFKKAFVHVSACPKRVICCDARQKDRILDLDNHSQTIFREIFTWTFLCKRLYIQTDVHQALSSIHAPFQNFHPAELVSTTISSLVKSRRCGFSRLAIVNYKKCLLHQLEQVQLHGTYLEKWLILFGDVQFFQGFENLSWSVV